MRSENERTNLAWNFVVLLLFLIGNVLVILSLAAEILGLDLTPGFGIVQMLQLLIGLTLLTLAGFIHIYSLRAPDAPRSLQADIGVRLAATGLVFAYVSGLSDLMGIGTHVQPAFERPYVGPLQLGGLVLGIVSITAGMILYHTSRGSRQTSSLEFLLNGSQKNQTAGENGAGLAPGGPELAADLGDGEEVSASPTAETADLAK
ncbi:MAG TPA: hypothetical protein VE553_10145 [Candidatus Binatia bacterium]|jgi:hypothetical protein|nr:hypothetical protein [Candidatus Binatia bacterium]